MTRTGRGQNSVPHNSDKSGRIVLVCLYIDKSTLFYLSLVRPNHPGISMLTTENPNELLNEKQAAELLGIAEQTLAGLRCNRRYNLAYAKIGRLVRYKRRNLERFIEKRTVRPGTAD